MDVVMQTESLVGSVSFNPFGEAGDGIQVLVLSISGENFGVSVQEDVTVLCLKQAIAAKYELEVFDFQLASGYDGGVLADDVLVGTLTVADSSEEASKAVSMYMVKHITLERYEQTSLTEWREVAAELQNDEIDDDTVLVHLCAFLNKHPALINFQSTCDGPTTPFKPLLSFAVESATSTETRQKCVDELINNGARINIRETQGYAIDQARKSGSAFVGYLESKAEEYKAYERESISAWRDVSSKLCGECSVQVGDEAEMTRIVSEFCTTYPEMVNFQSNHSVDHGTDKPSGYFGYAPLLTFAGARACRSRRGQVGDNPVTRKGAVEELLRYGARVDAKHGGKSAMEWMEGEGSQLVGWLQAQLRAPMPAHASFDFARGVGA